MSATGLSPAGVVAAIVIAKPKTSLLEILPVSTARSNTIHRHQGATMRHPIRNLLLVLAATALLAATAAPPAVSEPESGTTAPPPGEQPEPSRPEPGRDAPASFRDIIAPLWPGQSCTFRARADNPHESGDDVSGHGAWVNTSRPSTNCPSQAEVTVEIQAFACWEEGPLTGNCVWIPQGSDTDTVYSKEQVSVHFRCHTTEETTWRTKDHRQGSHQQMV